MINCIAFSTNVSIKTILVLIKNFYFKNFLFYNITERIFIIQRRNTDQLFQHKNIHVVKYI